MTLTVNEDGFDLLPFEKAELLSVKYFLDGILSLEEAAKYMQSKWTAEVEPDHEAAVGLTGIELMRFLALIGSVVAQNYYHKHETWMNNDKR